MQGFPWNLGRKFNFLGERGDIFAFGSKITMKKSTLLCSLWLASAALSTSPASAAPRTPKVGSPERKALMNALRPKLGNGGKHKPIISPSHLKVERGWAYIEGGWNYADGAPLEEEFQNGPGTNFSALLHREGSRWRVKRFVYAGDVQAPEAMREFPKAPRAIFQ